jgi:hypothetical protein
MSASNSINWNNGQLITLAQGDTAVCTGGLNQGQLYCIFFYNSASADADTTVSVTWSNSQLPVPVLVPGTTGKQGLASLCFVNGDDTNTVSLAVTQIQKGAQVQAFIGSVKMPLDSTGIINTALPLDGKLHQFEKFTRFFAVPESHWYSGQIQSDIDQFISVQLSEQSATVNIVNTLMNPLKLINYAGTCNKYVTTNPTKDQTVTWQLQGNGGQIVWINADSVQNSANATLTVQSLSAAPEASLPKK